MRYYVPTPVSSSTTRWTQIRFTSLNTFFSVAFLFAYGSTVNNLICRNSVIFYALLKFSRLWPCLARVSQTRRPWTWRPLPTVVDDVSIYQCILVFDCADTYTGNRRSTTIIVGCGYDDRRNAMTVIYCVPPQWRLLRARVPGDTTVPEKNLNTSLST